MRLPWRILSFHTFIHNISSFQNFKRRICKIQRKPMEILMKNSKFGKTFPEPPWLQVKRQSQHHHRWHGLGGGGRNTQYKRPVNVLPTLVAKSTSWYMKDPLWNAKFGVWMDRESKFSQFWAKIGSNLRKFWKKWVILFKVWRKIGPIGKSLKKKKMVRAYGSFKFRGGTSLPKPNLSTPPGVRHAPKTFSCLRSWIEFDDFSTEMAISLMPLPNGNFAHAS